MWHVSPKQTWYVISTLFEPPVTSGCIRIQTCELFKNMFIHWCPVSLFYTPRKRQKSIRFLTFSGGIKMWHWILMGYKITSTAFNSTFWRRSRMLFANFEEGEVTYLLWAMTQTGKTVASTASYFISSFDLVKAGKLLENIKFI